jgi:hypothetical protein
MLRRRVIISLGLHVVCHLVAFGFVSSYYPQFVGGTLNKHYTTDA